MHRGRLHAQPQTNQAKGYIIQSSCAPIPHCQVVDSQRVSRPSHSLLRLDMLYASTEPILVLDNGHLLPAGINPHLAARPQRRPLVEPPRDKETARRPGPYQHGDGRGHQQSGDEDEERDADPEQGEDDGGAEAEHDGAEGEGGEQQQREEAQQSLCDEKRLAAMVSSLAGFFFSFGRELVIARRRWRYSRRGRVALRRMPTWSRMRAGARTAELPSPGTAGGRKRRLWLAFARRPRCSRCCWGRWRFLLRRA